jgi:hypothetical protein
LHEGGRMGNVHLWSIFKCLLLGAPVIDDRRGSLSNKCAPDMPENIVFAMRGIVSARATVVPRFHIESLSMK